MNDRDLTLLVAVAAAITLAMTFTLVSCERRCARADAASAMLRQDIEDLQVRVNALEDRDGGPRP